MNYMVTYFDKKNFCCIVRRSRYFILLLIRYKTDKNNIKVSTYIGMQRIMCNSY